MEGESPHTITGAETDITMSGMEIEVSKPSYVVDQVVDMDNANPSQGMDISSNGNADGAQMIQPMTPEPSSSDSKKIEAGLSATSNTFSTQEAKFSRPDTLIVPETVQLTTSGLTLASPISQPPPVVDDYSLLTCTDAQWAEAIFRPSYYRDFHLEKSGYPTKRYYIFPEPSEGDLNGPLHPLVARNNWILNAENKYNRFTKLWEPLESALKQTSKFLSEENAMLAWLPLRFGKLINGEGGRQILMYDMPDNPKQELQQVIRELRDMAGKVKFCFGAIRVRTMQEIEDEEKEDRERRRKAGEFVPEPEIPKEEAGVDKNFRGGQIHGIHFAPNESFNRQIYVKPDFIDDLKRHEDLHRIFIHAGYTEYLSGAKSIRVKNPAVQLFTLFSLAITILHEISHAYFAQYRVDPRHFGSYDEPWYQGEPTEYSELGGALERHLFGIPMRALVDPNPNKGASIEAHFTPTAWVGEQTVVSESHVVARLEIGWMHSFKKESTWALLRSYNVGTKEGREMIRQCLSSPNTTCSQRDSLADNFKALAVTTQEEWNTAMMKDAAALQRAVETAKAMTVTLKAQQG
jgi:hypothetical protein